MFADMMWNNAARDLEAEQEQLARSAALQDVEVSVWPLLSAAVDERDALHRLALAAEPLRRAAAQRGYPVEALEQDLVRRWKLLSEARAASVPPPVRQDDSARVAAVAKLAARAAADNPGLPLARCLELAEAAAEQHAKMATAYPLAYENFGNVADGPFTDRAKHWKPSMDQLPGTPSAGGGSAAPSAGGGGTGGGGPSPAVFSDAPKPDTPVQPSGPASAPSFSDLPGADSAPRSTGPAPQVSFEDGMSQPSGPVQLHLPTDPEATFSHPESQSPVAPPSAPAAGPGFSHQAPPHVPRPRPAGPPELPLFRA
ncbi:hypothetical protein [Kitasatospora viridis]|uniref:Uncharacterized protein n=1 Tax=Kitasatospora viridis TaxID=281105 RepID=A0A561SA56_9ACTN|nr:hypothetical protein [Kitasatospora viridis]TWF71685.1 hypothetical protein FHX73_1856 [Kitasatospora viridis]